MQLTSTTTISALPPEVMTLIANNLRRHDLAACVLVNQTWSTVFNPSLWHTVAYEEPLPPPFSPSHDNNNNNSHSNRMDVHQNGNKHQRQLTWQLRVLRAIETGALMRSGHLICRLDVQLQLILFALVSENTVGGETVTGLKEFVVPPQNDLESFSAGIPPISSYQSFPVRLSSSSSPSVDINYQEQQQHHEKKGIAVRKALMTILQRNRDLRYVSIDGALLYDGDRKLCEKVRNALPPRLEHLVIRDWSRMFDDDSDQPDPSNDDNIDSLGGPMQPVQFTLPRLPCLKRLDIILCRIQDGILNGILRCCGNNIEILYLVKNTGYSTNTLSSTIRDHCPRLTSLVMQQWYPGSDREIADLIDASAQGWKTLCIPVGHHSKPRFGPLATAALLKHSATLENLRLEGHEGLGSRAIQELLSSAPHLRRFAGVGRDRFYGRSLQLDAKDIALSQWVCLSLESLRVQICNVPRPDVATRTNGRALPQKRQSSTEAMNDNLKGVQLKVYEQLGRLTRLRELVLGKDDVDLLEEVRMIEEENEGEYYDSGGEDDNGVQTGYQYDCLDMSVRSGMDRMQGLKELRSVVVEGMATRFWKREQQHWVKTYWPNVWTVRGGVKDKGRYKDPFWLQYGLPEYV